MTPAPTEEWADTPKTGSYITQPDMPAPQIKPYTEPGDMKLEIFMALMAVALMVAWIGGVV